MSLKLAPWLLLSAATLFACGEKEDDTAEEEEEEEETDTEDTDEPDPVVTEIEINGLAAIFYNGYQENDIAGVSVPLISEELTTGTFSVYIMNTVVQDPCVLEWEVTADTTEANADFDSGSLTDGFGGDALETWYGFTVTSTPTVNVNTQAVCDNMNQFGQDIMSLLMSATPSFGYGPQAGLAGDVTVGAEDLAFAGIVGLPFGEGAAASYFGLNESFAYEIVDGATSWDPGTSTYPQGSEIPVADVPFAEGFYIGNATSLISWQTE